MQQNFTNRMQDEQASLYNTASLTSLGQQPAAQGSDRDRFEYPFIFLDMVHSLCGVRIEFKSRKADPTSSDADDYSSSISEAEGEDSYEQYLTFAA